MTKPIESTFATVRHRTKITKGPGSRSAGLAMALTTWATDIDNSSSVVRKQRYREEHHLARYDDDTIQRLNFA